MPGGEFILPAITFFTTYLENIQGIFGFIPGYIERPFQAFMGTFIGGVFLSAVGSVSITSTLLKDIALVGASAAIGSVIGGAAGTMLGFGNPGLSAAVGAAIGCYLTEKKLANL